MGRWQFHWKKSKKYDIILFCRNRVQSQICYKSCFSGLCKWSGFTLFLMNINTDIQEGDKVDFFKFYPTAKNISFEISLCWAKLANAVQSWRSYPRELRNLTQLSTQVSDVTAKYCRNKNSSHLTPTFRTVMVGAALKFL